MDDSSQVQNEPSSATPVLESNPKKTFPIVFALLVLFILGAGGVGAYWFFSQNPPAERTVFDDLKTLPDGTPMLISKDDTNVYCNDNTIPGADATTFTQYSGHGVPFGFFTDANAVYYYCTELPGVNPTTFRVLNQAFATDGNEVVYFGLLDDRLISKGFVEILPEADGSSIQALTAYSVSDHDQVFQVVEKSDPSTALESYLNSATLKIEQTALGENTWASYTNSTYGYTIQYPSDKGWIYEEYGTHVGFGTFASRPGGFIWGVTVHDKNVIDLPTLISRMGDQFDDRKESRQNISINGVPALLVSVTTDQVDNWLSKVVYIERNDRIYTISNGATDNPDFIKFYSSFKFTN